jgi:hypothetical protein
MKLPQGHGGKNKKRGTNKRDQSKSKKIIIIK